MTLTAAQTERLDDARLQFAPDVAYLNTATLGLPPRSALDALGAAMDTWRRGLVDLSTYDEAVAAARALYARLVMCPTDWVAVGSQVSTMVGVIAACIPDGAEVVVVTGDFTSITFPFAAQAGRGVTVREVELESLADEIGDRTTLVAFAAVQSADGRVADLDAVVEACARTGSDVLLDVTQAVGWLPIDATRFAYTVCAGYKWLLAPRGTGYLTVAPDRRGAVVPQSAGWYAGAQVWDSIYGLPLRLAEDGRRFDVSPAWLSWVGAVPALELLTGVGRDALRTHAVGLADQLCRGLDVAPAGSAIVSVRADEAAASALTEAGVAAAVRAGRIRLSCHVSTSAGDVDRTIAALRPHVVERRP